jgi:hypothetical protein
MQGEGPGGQSLATQGQSAEFQDLIQRPASDSISFLTPAEIE